MQKDKNILNKKQDFNGTAAPEAKNNKRGQAAGELSGLNRIIFYIFVFSVIAGLLIFVISQKNIINKNPNQADEKSRSEDIIENNGKKFCGINNDAIPKIGQFELMLEKDQALTCFGKSVVETCASARVELTDNFTTSIILYGRKDADGKCWAGMIDNRTAETEQEIGKAEKYMECPFDIKNIEYLSPASPFKDYANFSINIYHYLNLEKEQGSPRCKGTLVGSKEPIEPSEIGDADIEKIKIDIEKSGGKFIEKNQ